MFPVSRKGCLDLDAGFFDLCLFLCGLLCSSCHVPPALDGGDGSDGSSYNDHGGGDDGSCNNDVGYNEIDEVNIF